MNVKDCLPPEVWIRVRTLRSLGVLAFQSSGPNAVGRRSKAKLVWPPGPRSGRDLGRGWRCRLRHWRPAVAPLAAALAAGG